MRVLFLASGNGGTMKFFHHAINTLQLDAEIIAVISDRECCSVDYAEMNGIPTKVFKPWREQTEDIVDAIKSYSPDYVITNIFKILPEEISQLRKELKYIVCN